MFSDRFLKFVWSSTRIFVRYIGPKSAKKTEINNCYFHSVNFFPLSYMTIKCHVSFIQHNQYHVRSKWSSIFVQWWVYMQLCATLYILFPCRKLRIHKENKTYIFYLDMADCYSTIMIIRPWTTMNEDDEPFRTYVYTTLLIAYRLVQHSRHFFIQVATSLLYRVSEIQNLL